VPGGRSHVLAAFASSANAGRKQLILMRKRRSLNDVIEQDHRATKERASADHVQPLP
jgi:transposase-like protein